MAVDMIRVRDVGVQKKRGGGGPKETKRITFLLMYSLCIDSLSLSLSLSRWEHLSNETKQNKTENDYDSIN